MKQEKVITVVIPTFNRKVVTDRAINSVKTNHPQDVEIVVVDDASDRRYKYQNRQNTSGVEVRVIRSRKNIGASLSRKAGVIASKGKIIAFLDSDDVYGREWIDHIIKYKNHKDIERLVLVGRTNGGRKINSIVYSLLQNLPDKYRLVSARIITVMFNPFYTSSIAMSKDICKFSHRLRYCEDYYTAAFGLFSSNELVLPKTEACKLGRKPSTKGGLSSSTSKMFIGELLVRIYLIKTENLLFRYKMMIPVGLLYQFIRGITKYIASSCGRHNKKEKYIEDIKKNRKSRIL